MALTERQLLNAARSRDELLAMREIGFHYVECPGCGEDTCLGWALVNIMELEAKAEAGHLQPGESVMLDEARQQRNWIS